MRKKSIQIKGSIVILIILLLMILFSQLKSTRTQQTDVTTTQKVNKLENSNTGKTLRIYCWNHEFQERFQQYVEPAGIIPKDIKVEWVITKNEQGDYQNALDTALKNQADKQPDERIDLFLVEADYALKYVDSDYTIDVRELGIRDIELKNQFPYTKKIATDSDGKLKGLTWQATPGVFVYRRSIAKDVLGTDDPEKVQNYLKTWNEFDQTAEKVHQKGYMMLSGYDDAYRVFSTNVTNPWVNLDKEIIIDDNMMHWVDQTKNYSEQGYNNRSSILSKEWEKDQRPGSKVFGFFYTTWGINFTLEKNSLEVPVEKGGKEQVGNGIYGDYAICEGPQNFYWGGTWMCAAVGTDNTELVANIMRKLACDKETMKAITRDTQDFTNNKLAMEELAQDGYTSSFLGGQNCIQMFTRAAENITMNNISKYDQGCNEEFQSAFHSYFEGKETKEKALERFYQAVIKRYPMLKKPGDHKE